MSEDCSMAFGRQRATCSKAAQLLICPSYVLCASLLQHFLQILYCLPKRFLISNIFETQPSVPRSVSQYLQLFLIETGRCLSTVIPPLSFLLGHLFSNASNQLSHQQKNG